MTYWKGAGNSLGEGMAAFTQNLLARQDQLRQQDQDAAKLAADNAYRQQQAAQAQQEYNNTRSDTLYNRAVGERENDYTKVLAPQMNAFMTGVQNDLDRYAPTLKDGSANPQYDPALYQGAQDRKKQSLKLWSDVGLGVGHGEGWDDNKGKFLAFIGNPTGQQATPTTDPAAAPMTAPQVAPAQPQTVSAGTASVSFTPEPQSAAAPTAAAAPVTPQTAPPTVPTQSAAPTAAAIPATAAPQTALPSDVKALSGADLQKVGDDQIAAHYGQGGLEYARAKRAAYALQVQQQQKDAAEIRAKGWQAQLAELSKRPDLTGDQRLAMATVTTLMSKTSLTDSEAQQLTDAFHQLTPRMYDATSWQKVLDTKDPQTILAQLPVYQKNAPDVVQGFDVTPFQQAITDTHNKNAADIASANATAGKNNADAGRVTALLPGEVTAQTDTHNASLAGVAKTNADTAATQATTTKTAQETKIAAYDSAVKKLAVVAVPGSTPAQMIQADPSGWYALKRDLGMTDPMLAAAFNQARYLNDQGLDATELENQLKRSKILTEGATRAGVIATTAATQAGTQKTLTLLPGEVQQQGAQLQATAAQTAASQAQANVSNANAQHTTQMLPIDIATGRTKNALTVAQTTQTAADTGHTLADTARVGASTANIQQQTQNLSSAMKNERDKTAAYVASTKGQAAVDVAHVANLNAQTALDRAKNPNDPLYSPLLASSKSGDPVDAVKKRAGIYYTQSDQALKQAQTYQGQINALIKQGTDMSGFDATNLSPADQKRLSNLTQSRDALMTRAMNSRAQGDQVISDQLPGAAQKMPAPVDPNTGTPFATLGTLPGTKMQGIKPVLVDRIDTMLHGFQAPGGLVPVINQGFRTRDDQAKLYAQGRTAPGKIVTNSPPGSSNHESGNAIDISWKDPQTGQVLAGNDPRAQAAWKALGSQAPRYGLRWGGTFPAVDMYHFEVYGQPQGQPQAIPQGQPVHVQSAPVAAPAPVQVPPSTFQGSAAHYASALNAIKFTQRAANIKNAQDANLFLSHAIQTVAPGATADVQRSLRHDLALSLGW